MIIKSRKSIDASVKIMNKIKECVLLTNNSSSNSNNKNDVLEFIPYNVCFIVILPIPRIVPGMVGERREVNIITSKLKSR
jgi:hypothetical protein